MSINQSDKEYPIGYFGKADESEESWVKTAYKIAARIHDCRSGDEFELKQETDELLWFIARLLEKQKKEVLKILTDEINLAHTTKSGKTSRLTSAYSKVSSLSINGK